MEDTRSILNGDAVSSSFKITLRPRKPVDASEVIVVPDSEDETNGTATRARSRKRRRSIPKPDEDAEPRTPEPITKRGKTHSMEEITVASIMENIPLSPTVSRWTASARQAYFASDAPPEPLVCKAAFMMFSHTSAASIVSLFEFARTDGRLGSLSLPVYNQLYTAVVDSVSYCALYIKAVSEYLDAKKENTKTGVVEPVGVGSDAALAGFTKMQSMLFRVKLDWLGPMLSPMLNNRLSHVMGMALSPSNLHCIERFHVVFDSLTQLQFTMATIARLRASLA